MLYSSPYRRRFANSEKERGEGRGETEKEKSPSRGIAKRYFEFHGNATWDSEINQIQLHNPDYRVRNLIYLRVIVHAICFTIPCTAGRRKRHRRYFAGTGMNLADPSWPWGNLSNCMLVIVITARPAIIAAKSQSALPFSRP